jgi:hypothetical protein
METPDAHKNSELVLLQFEKVASSRRLNLNQILKEHFSSEPEKDEASDKTNNITPDTEINQ